MILQKNYLGNEALKTIYFGGGTPSILTPEEIAALLSTATTTFDASAVTEITLEANPDDLTPATLTGFKQAGVNRLSIGIQSFDDHILRSLNRSHTSQTATECIRQARSAGFTNISLDLIFGIPGQSLTQWQHNIEQALRLEPEHISCYALTIEEKTVFGRRAAKGNFTATPEDHIAEEMELLMDMLSRHGFEQYEVSNFCRPGYWSKHNSSYWQQEKYLGIGPSAHSYNGVSRQFNISNNHLYVKSIERDTVPFTLDELSPENRVNEYLLTTLRTSRGCDLSKLKTVYATDLAVIHGQYIQQLTDQQLATLEGSILRLSKKGFLLADKIAADLFL